MRWHLGVMSPSMEATACLLQRETAMGEEETRLSVRTTQKVCRRAGMAHLLGAFEAQCGSSEHFEPPPCKLAMTMHTRQWRNTGLPPQPSIENWTASSGLSMALRRPHRKKRRPHQGSRCYRTEKCVCCWIDGVMSTPFSLCSSPHPLRNNS
jgi:hypothetical protein